MEFQNALLGTFSFFQFPSTAKVFSYHLLYNSNKFFADIGGYLGLFLGLSVFSISEIVWKRLFKGGNKKI